jgi:RNA polymerase sigma-70 factor (TIGR02960 family)
VTQELLAGARAGDEEAFRQLTDPYRGELQVHCYRMLGSFQDAEDALQETLLAAWRGLPGFAERASLRAWLYRIATNRCLNALRSARRRPEPPQPPFPVPEPTRLGEPARLEPYPDALLDAVADGAPGPEARVAAREAIELAFITGLQHLPARQRAALVLRDVLGFSTAEVARMLGTSEAAVKGALQRARAALDGQPRPEQRPDRGLARRFAEAFEADDVDAVVALLTEDARLTMPPSPLEYHGRAAVAAFLRASARYRAGRRFHLVPTRANGQPAFGLYVDEADEPFARAAGLIVLTVGADGILAVTRFLDQRVLSRFDLPEVVSSGDTARRTAR